MHRWFPTMVPESPISVPKRQSSCTNLVGAVGFEPTNPSLVRRNRTVAGRRPTSPVTPSSCTNSRRSSPCVARLLPTLAPRLAPRNLVSLTNAVRIGDEMYADQRGSGLPSHRHDGRGDHGRIPHGHRRGRTRPPPTAQRWRARNCFRCRSRLGLLFGAIRLDLCYFLSTIVRPLPPLANRITRLAEY